METDISTLRLENPERYREKAYKELSRSQQVAMLDENKLDRYFAEAGTVPCDSELVERVPVLAMRTAMTYGERIASLFGVSPSPFFLEGFGAFHTAKIRHGGKTLAVPISDIAFSEKDFASMVAQMPAVVTLRAMNSVIKGERQDLNEKLYNTCTKGHPKLGETAKHLINEGIYPSPATGARLSAALQSAMRWKSLSYFEKEVRDHYPELFEAKIKVKPDVGKLWETMDLKTYFRGACMSRRASPDQLSLVFQEMYEDIALSVRERKPVLTDYPYAGQKDVKMIEPILTDENRVTIALRQFSDKIIAESKAFENDLNLFTMRFRGKGKESERFAANVGDNEVRTYDIIESVASTMMAMLHNRTRGGGISSLFRERCDVLDRLYKQSGDENRMLGEMMTFVKAFQKYDTNKITPDMFIGATYETLDRMEFPSASELVEERENAIRNVRSDEVKPLKQGELSKDDFYGFYAQLEETGRYEGPVVETGSDEKAKFIVARHPDGEGMLVRRFCDDVEEKLTSELSKHDTITAYHENEKGLTVGHSNYFISYRQICELSMGYGQWLENTETEHKDYVVFDPVTDRLVTGKPYEEHVKDAAKKKELEEGPKRKEGETKRQGSSNGVK